jgi:hypothetical protein
MLIKWSDDNPTENVEFTLLRSIPNLLLDCSLEELMEQFVQHSQKMYKPMVYVCRTDLDFPFNETMLPALKEKLIREISG